MPLNMSGCVPRGAFVAQQRTGRMSEAFGNRAVFPPTVSRAKKGNTFGYLAARKENPRADEAVTTQREIGPS
jgi:hypothetical protein